MAEHDAPESRRLELGRSSEVGDHPVAQPSLVQLDQHAGRQISDEPNGRGVSPALADQAGGEGIGRTSPGPGASNVLPTRSLSWKSDGGSRSRMPIGNWWFSWQTTVSSREEPAYIRGHPESAQGEVGRPGLQVVDHTCPGILGRRLDRQPGLGEEAGGPARYSGR